jgi:hypothetical protein
MLTETSHGTAATDRADVVALRRSAAIRVAIALLYASVGTAVAVVVLWGPLRTKTDVIGYPIFANFNPYNYSRAYYLVVGAFPIAALLIFLALTRIGPRLGLATPPARGRLRPVTSPPETVPELDEQPFGIDGVKGRTVAAWRVAFVGAVLGLEVGIASEHLWLSLALVVPGYCAATGLASVGLGQIGSLRATGAQRLAAVNALGASLCVVGLALVSAHTQVHVLSDGSTRHYSWFPLWLALPVAAVLFAWTLRSLRHPGHAGATAIERRAALLIAAPVALLLLFAYLHGDIGQINLFEEGQLLAESRLVGAGWLPWRDIVVTHGLLVDVFQTWTGFAVFGNSYWGALAGGSLLFQPLYVLGMYFLFVYLVGRSWTLTLLGSLIYLGTWLGPADPRLLLWPVILLVMAGLLKRPTRSGAAALGFLTVAEAILTPEALGSVLAVTVVLAAYESYWRPAGQPFAQAYRRTIWYAAGGVALAAGFAIYMASRGALGDVVYVTINLINGHTLDGALPPTANAWLPHLAFYFIALAPPGAVLVSFAYAAVRLRLRRPFLAADWPMAAAAVFVLIYYSQFLARMDTGHAYQPFMIATPLLLYILYRVVTALERALRDRLAEKRARWLPAQPIGLALAICMVVFFWGPIHDRIEGSPAAYHRTVASRPTFASVGYATEFEGGAFRDLRRIINAYLGPHGRLLDLTNEAALFYYFIKRDPSTRWYVPNGIVATAELQRDMLDELRRDPPKLVVLDDTDLTMAAAPSFDKVPAMVRMYLISRWIFGHYRPLLISHGRTIYAQRGLPPASSLHLHLQQQATTTGVPFLGHECSWGDAPNFLAGPAEPPPSAPSIAAHIQTASSSLAQIDQPVGSKWADYRWLELDAPRSVFRQGSFALSDRSDSPGKGRVIGFESLRGSPGRYIVPVSSCPQWHGYSSSRLFLVSSPTQPIAGIRLIR